MIFIEMYNFLYFKCLERRNGCYIIKWRFNEKCWYFNLLLFIKS